jgi:hypothetical protein
MQAIKYMLIGAIGVVILLVIVALASAPAHIDSREQARDLLKRQECQQYTNDKVLWDFCMKNSQWNNAK